MPEEITQKMHLQQPPTIRNRGRRKDTRRLGAVADAAHRHVQTGASSSPPPSASSFQTHPLSPQKPAQTTTITSTKPPAPTHPSNTSLQQRNPPVSLQPLPLPLPTSRQKLSARIRRHQRDLEELLHRVPDTTMRVRLFQERVRVLIAQPGNDGGDDTDAREGIKLFVRAAEEQVPAQLRVSEVEIVQKQQVQLAKREGRVGWLGVGRILDATMGERGGKKGGPIITSGRCW